LSDEDDELSSLPQAATPRLRAAAARPATAAVRPGERRPREVPTADPTVSSSKRV
jgi:hypothetical protein